MMLRLGNSPSAAWDSTNEAAGAVEQFYNANSAAMFTAAKSIGGVKVVREGQRTFGPSALSATRIAGLYCDTQLILDPVFPFFAAQLHLNARREAT